MQLADDQILFCFQALMWAYDVDKLPRFKVENSLQYTVSTVNSCKLKLTDLIFYYTE